MGFRLSAEEVEWWTAVRFEVQGVLKGKLIRLLLNVKYLFFRETCRTGHSVSFRKTQVTQQAINKIINVIATCLHVFQSLLHSNKVKWCLWPDVFAKYYKQFVLYDSFCHVICQGISVFFWCIIWSIYRPKRTCRATLSLPVEVSVIPVDCKPFYIWKVLSYLQEIKIKPSTVDRCLCSTEHMENTLLCEWGQDVELMK